MNTGLYKTAFIKMLTSQARDFMPERRSDSIRALKRHEEYVYTVLMAASELVTIQEQLEHSVYFLSSFKATPPMKKKGINKLDYILYQLENYLIRTTSCLDRALILTNDVFILGNEPRNCVPQIILKNHHIIQSPVGAVLKELDEHVKPYREQRNLVIHRQRYRQEETYRLELIYLLQKEDSSLVPPNMIRVLTQEFLLDKKREMGEFNEILYLIVIKLFETLKPEYERRHSELRNAA